VASADPPSPPGRRSPGTRGVSTSPSRLAHEDRDRGLERQGAKDRTADVKGNPVGECAAGRRVPRAGGASGDHGRGVSARAGPRRATPGPASSATRRRSARRTRNRAPRRASGLPSRSGSDASLQRGIAGGTDSRTRSTKLIAATRPSRSARRQPPGREQGAIVADPSARAGTGRPRAARAAERPPHSSSVWRASSSTTTDRQERPYFVVRATRHEHAPPNSGPRDP